MLLQFQLISFAYILVPAHRGNHWGLNFVDIEGCTISYLDSVGGKYPEGLSKLKQFLVHDTGIADWTEVHMKVCHFNLFNFIQCIGGFYNSLFFYFAEHS